MRCMRCLILFLGIFFLFSVSYSYAIVGAGVVNDITNGEFNNGFQNWSGEIVNNFYDIEQVNPTTSSYFNIVGPNTQAKINIDDDYWNNTLYQDFFINYDPLEEGWRKGIKFWIKWVPSDSKSDEVSVTLSDFGNDYLDLLENIDNESLLQGTWVSVDITDFAKSHKGQMVEIDFNLSDRDLYISDLLYIDNVSTFYMPSVPLPNTLVLIGAGLVFCMFLSQRRVIA